MYPRSTKFDKLGISVERNTLQKRRNSQPFLKSNYKRKSTLAALRQEKLFSVLNRHTLILIRSYRNTRPLKYNSGISYNKILDNEGEELSASESRNGYLDEESSSSKLLYHNETSTSMDDRHDHIFDDNYLENFEELSEGYSLPRKTVKIRRKLDNSTLPNNRSLLNTNILPDSFRKTFSFDYFNRMQSEAFGDVYGSDKNCIISAPTGSGKTVLFELAIMRLVKNSDYKMDNIKILYIAPTKSLCYEKYNSWGKLFLNLSVGILTGDSSVSESEKVKKCNIIITTPEKWDVLTRKWWDYIKLFELVKLILVDEIHTLKEKRGATLEVVLTRMNCMCQDIRIIGVSATIPNLNDIALWLRNSETYNKQTAAKALNFDDSYRQVSLKKYVQGYNFSTKNEFQRDNIYNTKLPTIIRDFSKGKPILIFCPTRSSTVVTAKYLAQNTCFQNDKSHRSSFTANISDRTLLECIGQNIAYHHAGLSLDERKLVEESFKNGNIKILCCTSTLAVGVNLPAFLVIIKGTKFWSTSTSEEYSQLDILQMVGRAGRPQFEKEGCAVIMTDMCMKQYYENLINGTDELESSLHLELLEHLSAEISIGTITNVTTALEWLKNTFFYIRYKKNPSSYYSVNHYSKINGFQDSKLLQFIQALLERLEKAEIIELNLEAGDKYNSKINCTAYGQAMTRHYILFNSMTSFISIKYSQSVANILNTVSNAEEYSTIRVRQNEKKLYREINMSPLIKYPYLTKNQQSQIIDNRSQKVSLIIQYELGGLEFPSYQGASKLHQSFLQDKHFIFKHCLRILKCMIDVFIFKKDGVSLKNTLFLLRCATGNCWEDTPMVLRQLKNIGLVSVRKFVNHNILNLEEVSKLSESQLEYFLCLKIGNGIKIKRDIESLPSIQLRVKLENCSIQGKQLLVRFGVEISSKFKSTMWHGTHLSVNIVTMKSIGELIDFRRVNLSHLRAPKSFTVETIISSKQIDIEFEANFQEIADIKDSKIFTSKDLHPQYFNILRETESFDALNRCLFVPEDGNTESLDSMSSDDSILRYFDVDTSAKDSQSSKQAIPSNQCPELKKITDRKRYENGNYSCNHKCHNKENCRHLCCKEGIPETFLKLPKNQISGNTIQESEQNINKKKIHKNKEISILLSNSFSNSHINKESSLTEHLFQSKNIPEKIITQKDYHPEWKLRSFDLPVNIPILNLESSEYEEEVPIDNIPVDFTRQINETSNILIDNKISTGLRSGLESDTKSIIPDKNFNLNKDDIIKVDNLSTSSSSSEIEICDNEAGSIGTLSFLGSDVILL
ncbi:hypothetical protein TBLA_0E00120 [Henningerozyma blattae CBS 6284]|uniref:DNA 3'-5' helicase n=1 Tax=Henningerozyma blattae (strain ATCC 34711 / CBS 6284 / DSM 70876 / NBRC 10599 / NRRL Y-10934 / UCD 77-7) TaxID=1071380 RepID=I2H3X3_HENB6|nr:hypothetical protein TBLA_0E00120 [Tetrapisispora blattae CBS 6284]CCH61075.1 hypothetical protein TBLA_0E00120 [Tetrapisispora blattae CBS 6284]